MFGALLVFSVSLAAGVLAGLLGIGGGILMVPGFAFLVGMEPIVAIGTSLFVIVVVATNSAAIHLRREMVNLRVALFLEAATAPGALGGALLAPLLGSRVLLALFGLLLLYAAWRMWVPGSVKRGGGNLGLGVALSGLAGVMSGLLGVGGGVLKVPIMYRAVGLSAREAMATSAFMVAITASVGALTHLAQGHVSPSLAIPAALGGLAGSSLGAWFMPRVPSKGLRRVFALVLVAAAVQSFVKAL